MTGIIEGQKADQVRLQGRHWDEIVDSWIARIPSGRAVNPTEVAELIAFLASSRASGINGAIVPVDLGLTVG